MTINPRAETEPAWLAQVLDRQWLRFLMVGFSNFLLSFLTFHAVRLALVEWQGRSSLAQVAAYAVGTMWSFLWNRRWTFKSELPVSRQAAKFVLLQVSLALSSAGIIGYAVDRLDLPASATWLMVMGVITVVNFLLCKYWAFR